MRIKRRKKIDIFTVFIIFIVVLLLISAVVYYNYNEKVVGKNFTNQIIVTTTDSSIRTGPDEEFPIITNISSGEKIQKQSQIGDWIEIKTTNNIVGWIAGWDILDSGIKSPEEKFKEQLTKYTVLINPIYVENIQDYNLEYANYLKKELEKINIKSFVTREKDEYIDKTQIENMISEFKADIVININISTTEMSKKGPELYYDNYPSQILSKYIEKSLANNYIMKTKSSEKNAIATPVNSNIPEIFAIIGNVANDVDINIIKNNIYKDEYVTALKKGIENYFYYLLRIEDQNNKRRDALLNMPQKGLNVPFYYKKQDEFKDISYGNDNNKKISDNGDLIISLAMVVNYIDSDSKLNVSSIVDWAGLNYYNYGLGTNEKLISEFAKNNNYKLDIIDKDLLKNIDDALANNRPVLVKFKAGGLFGKKPTYKVIRGLEDGKYYINDPDDDDLKLNNYTGFDSIDIEQNIVKSWVLYK